MKRERGTKGRSERRDKEKVGMTYGRHRESEIPHNQMATSKSSHRPIMYVVSRVSRSVAPRPLSLFVLGKWVGGKGREESIR